MCIITINKKLEQSPMQFYGRASIIFSSNIGVKLILKNKWLEFMH